MTDAISLFEELTKPLPGELIWSVEPVRFPLGGQGHVALVDEHGVAEYGPVRWMLVEEPHLELELVERPVGQRILD
jgi:hypothetical protein